MKLKERIEALSFLGKEIQAKPDWLNTPITQAYYENQWFTEDNSWKALSAISDRFLQISVLQSWAEGYGISDNKVSKKVGLVLAGNIPLVGFHDIMSTFISGHDSLIKASSKDTILLKALFDWLIDKYPEAKPYFEFTDRLAGFDAVIATGSNNTARYFEQYFGKYPNIIRKNRTAVAVLEGAETKEDILALGEDVFNYFGLGCRNVSKLYVPENYNFDFLLGILHEEYKTLANHNKYRNNFDYNNALFLLNKVEFLMSGSLIITPAKDITSRIATLHYENYTDVNELSKHLREVSEQIQCVVSKTSIPAVKTFAFGEAQKPSITDYADGVDTMQFLTTL